MVLAHKQVYKSMGQEDQDIKIPDLLQRCKRYTLEKRQSLQQNGARTTGYSHTEKLDSYPSPGPKINCKVKILM